MGQATQRQSENSKTKPRNGGKSFDKSKDDKRTAYSPFAAQNGLGEVVETSSFEQNGQSQAEQGSPNKTNGQQNQNSPFDNLASIMQKKNEFEKMMPMFSTLFSKNAKTAETKPQKEETAQDSQSKNEPDKSKDIFFPIAFAGYTAICAMNRLYFR
ncbi:MAG: hypothetical protein IJ226_03930 [Clostridia bacterium]|nr:hypothetical protein [Clostridia bacterium]